LCLSVWVVRLKQKADLMEAAGRPQAVARLYTLKPSLPARRAGKARTTRIDAVSSSFLIAVDIPRETMVDSRFDVRLLDAGQRELWQEQDAHVDPSGKLIVRIGKNFLDPGEYALEVTAYGGTSGEEGTTVIFPFLISNPQPQ
jgi:hypothetical protein